MSLAELSAMLNASKASGGSANLNLGAGRGAAAAAASSGGAPSSAASPAALKQHADHMWRFLDELAASDPEGYKAFMAGQMQEMAAEKARAAETEAMFTPTPAFVLYTRQTAGKGGERTLYLNLCTSPQIPPLQTKDQKGPADPSERDMGRILVPLSVGAIKADEDRTRGEVWTADIVFNPGVMSRALAGGDLSFKLFLIELALQHLEADEGCTLHRAYKLIPPSEATYVGGGAKGRPSQQKTEAELAREKFLAQMKADREEQIKNMATKSSKDIVMPSLSKTQQAKQEYEEQAIKELKLRPEAAPPAAASSAGAAKGGAAAAAKPQQKRVLIEDLTPDQGEDPSLTADAPAPAPAATAAPKPKVAPASSSSSSSSAAAAKPAITLASTTKLNSAASASSSSAAAASSSAAARPAAASASSSAAAPSSTAKSTASADEGAWSSKLSSAISSADFLSSLASIPVEDSPSPWPYGSSAASMSSTSTAATLSATSVAAGQRVQPTHSMSVSAEGQLELAIQLPLVNSVGELDVDVSRTQLQLTSDKYAITVTFPGPIFEDRSAAKFVKKQHTLKITATMR